MSETLKKTYTAGLGLIVLTYEKAEKLAKDLVKKGAIAKEKQQEMIDKLIQKAKNNTNQVEKTIKAKIDQLSEKGEPLKKKQDELVKDISERAKEIGGLTEKNIKKIITDIMEKSKKTRAKILSGMSFDEKIEAALAKLNVPTQQDIDEIKLKLDELIKLQESRKSKQEMQ